MLLQRSAVTRPKCFFFLRNVLKFKYGSTESHADNYDIRKIADTTLFSVKLGSELRASFHFALPFDYYILFVQPHHSLAQSKHSSADTADIYDDDADDDGRMDTTLHIIIVSMSHRASKSHAGPCFRE